MTIRGSKLVLTGLLLVMVNSPVMAEIVSLQMPNGLWASAEYVEGDEDKPVVMIVHGFLQTRDFSTVSRLGNSLKEEGYSVLMPTLTLNVDQRQQSVACEAIHSHTMQNDSLELQAWLEWVAQKSDKPITLVGHSAGSTNIIAALNGDKNPRISGVILISLLHFDEDPLSHNTAEAYEKALKLQEQGVTGLESYSLAFCAEYPSEPGPFISYREWGKNKTIEALNILQYRPSIILGGSDGRITPDWLEALRSTEANLIVVEDAGHFFDAQTEFDLLDNVAGQLDHFGL